MPPASQRSFHAFTLRHKGIVDRLISDVRISVGFDLTAAPPHPKSIPARALWDTGATASVITKQTATNLGLTPAGVARVRHAGGTSDQARYVVNLFLPNHVSMQGVFVTECVNTIGDFGVIIGMDIISAGDLAISNHGGKTTMTFRVPSVDTIDFERPGQ